VRRRAAPRAAARGWPLPPARATAPCCCARSLAAFAQQQSAAHMFHVGISRTNKQGQNLCFVSDKRRFFSVHFWTICATHAPLWIGGVGGARGRGAGSYWVSSRTALAATPAAFARPQRRIVLERARRAPTHRARPQNRCVALARSHQTSPVAQLRGPSGALARPESAPPRGDGQYRERTHHQPRGSLAAWCCSKYRE
jgi:hypothetical protein